MLRNPVKLDSILVIAGNILHDATTSRLMVAVILVVEEFIKKSIKQTVDVSIIKPITSIILTGKVANKFLNP